MKLSISIILSLFFMLALPLCAVGQEPLVFTYDENNRKLELSWKASFMICVRNASAPEDFCDKFKENGCPVDGYTIIFNDKGEKDGTIASDFDSLKYDSIDVRVINKDSIGYLGANVEKQIIIKRKTTPKAGNDDGTPAKNIITSTPWSAEGGQHLITIVSFGATNRIMSLKLEVIPEIIICGAAMAVMILLPEVMDRIYSFMSRTAVTMLLLMQTATIPFYFSMQIPVIAVITMTTPTI